MQHGDGHGDRGDGRSGLGLGRSVVYSGGSPGGKGREGRRTCVRAVGQLRQAGRQQEKRVAGVHTSLLSSRREVRVEVEQRRARGEQVAQRTAYGPERRVLRGWRRPRDVRSILCACGRVSGVSVL